MVYLLKNGLRVEKALVDNIERLVIPGTGVSPDNLWSCLSSLVLKFSDDNAALLSERDRMQRDIDVWYKNLRQGDASQNDQRTFLQSIGYLCSEKGPFAVCTENVDPEIATLASPQLVVPVDNSRYALNAANARWGSLFDALYSSDVLGSSAPARPPSSQYSEQRGKAVAAYVLDLLDEFLPLEGHSWESVRHVWVERRPGVEDYVLLLRGEGELRIQLKDSQSWKGFSGSSDKGFLVFKHNDLHLLLILEPSRLSAKSNRLGLADVLVEAAGSVIMDCEDSVAAVDAEDKAKVYSNWAGLMRGDLAVTLPDGKVRRLRDNLQYLTPSGEPLSLKGRAVCLVRNVDLQMKTDAVQKPTEGGQWEDVFEGLLDTLFTVVGSLHDISSSKRNSEKGSIYVVKPKLHGPDEVAFVCRVFGEVERLLGLSVNTIKLGLMDEERRTSVNLYECIRSARERIVFVNTGFLDRTGDEIHTCMEGGPVLPKAEIKGADCITAYEKLNVLTGIRTGLMGKGQIGKGMWAEPDSMRNMILQKINHPQSGASTAWVPSPTAATLHALHYHRCLVGRVQKDLAAQLEKEDATLLSSYVESLLTPPFLHSSRRLSKEEMRKEARTNIQGILGYVVRWVDQGVGCSKVPDLEGKGLMEDRATLRISSQLLANWMHHGLLSKTEVHGLFRELCFVVDQQNRGDPSYAPMGGDPSNLAFVTAQKLVFEGLRSPNGYTAEILTAARKERKRIMRLQGKL